MDKPEWIGILEQKILLKEIVGPEVPREDTRANIDSRHMTIDEM